MSEEKRILQRALCNVVQRKTREEEKMSFTTTMGKYCFVECDMPGCGKKIEHIDPSTLKQLAKLCGWERNDDEWFCAECAERLHGKAPAGKGQRSPSQGNQKKSAAR